MRNKYMQQFFFITSPGIANYKQSSFNCRNFHTLLKCCCDLSQQILLMVWIEKKQSNKINFAHQRQLATSECNNENAQFAQNTTVMNLPVLTTEYACRLRMPTAPTALPAAICLQRDCQLLQQAALNNATTACINDVDSHKIRANSQHLLLLYAFNFEFNYFPYTNIQ